MLIGLKPGPSHESAHGGWGQRLASGRLVIDEVTRLRLELFKGDLILRVRRLGRLDGVEGREYARLAIRRLKRLDHLTPYFYVDLCNQITHGVGMHHVQHLSRQLYLV